jgi:hypothetical protein
MAMIRGPWTAGAVGEARAIVTAGSGVRQAITKMLWVDPILAQPFASPHGAVRACESAKGGGQGPERMRSSRKGLATVVAPWLDQLLATKGLFHGQKHAFQQQRTNMNESQRDREPDHSGLKRLWIESRGKILAAIVGVIAGAAITQTFAIHNFYRFARYQRQHDILNSTRLGIGFLKQIETEMDENTILLLNHEYNITIEFGKPFDQAASLGKIVETAAKPSTNAADAQQYQGFAEFYKTMGGPAARLEKLEVPLQTFSTSVWDHGIPEVADIQYALLRDSSEYYLLVRRVNETMKGFSDVHPGNIYFDGYAQQLTKLASVHNAMVTKLKDSAAVTIKSRLEDEMQRLSSMRQKIETSAVE